MKLTILFFTLIFSCSLFCQTTRELDNRNGFKELKLGTSFSELKDQILHLETLDNGERIYRYKGDCCNKLFDYQVDQIVLAFYLDKLVAITVFTELFQKPYDISGKYTEFRTDDFMMINSSFEKLFGPPTHREAGNGKALFSWIGDKVVLISNYDSGTVTSGDRQIVVVNDREYFDREYFDDKTENGF